MTQKRRHATYKRLGEFLNKKKKRESELMHGQYTGRIDRLLTNKVRSHKLYIYTNIYMKKK
jgi:hypothetical protein